MALNHCSKQCLPANYFANTPFSIPNHFLSTVTLNHHLWEPSKLFKWRILNSSGQTFLRYLTQYHPKIPYQPLFTNGWFWSQNGLNQFHATCGQSYKASTIVNYDTRVIHDLKKPILRLQSHSLRSQRLYKIGHLVWNTKIDLTPVTMHNAASQGRPH